MTIAWLMCGLLMLDGEPQALPDTQAVVEFQRAADEYAFMHRRIERRLPPIEVTANVDSLRQVIVSMATAIRSARPDAREGDFFTASLQPILRARIVKAMRQHGITIADLEHGDINTAPAQLAVNGDMPWRQTGSMPPCVLDVLPPLPAELEYRLVFADLVLVDVHASLIVDVLRDAAIPMETFR